MGDTDFTIAFWVYFDVGNLTSRYHTIYFFKNSSNQHSIWARTNNGPNMDQLFYRNTSSYVRCIDNNGIVPRTW